MANEPAVQGPKGPKGRASAKHKRSGKYSRQRVRTEANKLAACTRHVAQHPRDEFGRVQLLARQRGI